jgi:hypothetical protein
MVAYPFSSARMRARGLTSIPSGDAGTIVAAGVAVATGADALRNASSQWLGGITSESSRTLAEHLLDRGTSVKTLGAKGDVVQVTNSTGITSGDATLTVGGAVFVTADVGKTIIVPGAGAAGADLVTTILSRTSNTVVELATNASTTLSFPVKTVTYGTDDTTAINAALTRGGQIYIPAGLYIYKGGGVIDKPALIEGHGSLSALVIPGDVGASTDLFTLTPSATTVDRTKRGWQIKNFCIITVGTATPARHAFHVDITTSGRYLPQFLMSGIICHRLGGNAFRLTNPTNVDGLFCGDIECSWLQGGIYLDRIGDSFRIWRNTLSGTGIGIEMSMVTEAGAAQIGIEKNNITTTGGAMILHRAAQVKIRDNQIEQGTYVGSEEACIVLKGDITQLTSIEIDGNNIKNGANLLYGIDIVNAAYTKIARNVINADAATKHIRIGASTTETRIHDDNDFRSASAATAARVDVDAAAAGVCGVPTVVSSAVFLTSGAWVAYDSVNNPVRYVKNTDGTVKLEGAVKSGSTGGTNTIFILPAGFRPPFAQYFSAVNSNSGWKNEGVVTITSTGAVQWMAGGNVFIGLDNISFKAAL